MVTKLKRFSREWYSKFAAYLLILALAAWFTVSYIAMFSKVGDPSAFESKTYAGSSVCSSELERVFSNVLVMHYEYVSEENVRNGGALEEREIYQRIYDSNAYSRYRSNYYEDRNYEDGNEIESADITPADLNASLAIMQEHPDWEMFEDGVFVRYLSENPQLVPNMRQSLIDDQLRNFQRVKTYLESVKNQFAFYSYWADKASELKSDSQERIRQMPIYVTYDLVENSIAFYQNGERKNWHEMGYSSYNQSRMQNYIGAEDKLLVGIYPEYLSQREAEWQQDHRIATNNIIIIIFSFLISACLFIYLCVVTGRVPGERDVRLYLIDRMYSEVHLTILIILFAIFIGMMEGMSLVLINMWPMMVGMVCSIVAVAIPVILSLIRSLKAHRFFRSFAIGRLCIRFCRWVMRTLRGIWEGGSLMARGVMLAVIVPVLCMPWFTVPFIIAALIYIVYRTVSRFQKVQEGVRQVRGGDLNYKIDVKGGDLGMLAEDINTLSEGLETAISSEVKAERLKTELISNVSHDIKTPLTSIVTYVDLLNTELAKEQPDNNALREYAAVIDKKTSRLRVLTNDLFEAAKATSGAMTVALEQVDVQALVRQGLGEFDDKLHAAQLDMRVNMPEKPVYIAADGRLVWRILENILSNVIKYALTGSRVYLDVTTGQGQVWLTVKNISAYELNVPAEELMERFKRGDESRTSEGSGLGLSIATSLAQLQHGVFTIAVDGDLFKATLAMPVYRFDTEMQTQDFEKKENGLKK